ncbi:MAG: hypothetical protein M1832_004263 [Thelocarpon impressellum]|nr:MAG: hypothetical protein M1832_004263 [Thelocarpon impressellum]
METVNNATAAAQRALFGNSNRNTTNSQSGSEPVSGSTPGAGTANEPYDTGNTHSGPHLAGTAGSHNSATANKLDPNVHSSATGTHTSDNPNSSNAGPHDSNIANKADPRVDSDRDGSTATGSTSVNAGPHDSNIANKADPRVDSDRDGSTVTGNTSNAGPHDSNIANKADPRVDSDRDGSTATGNTFSNAGPHGSNIANKADPRVDSDRDGSSATGNASHGGVRFNEPNFSDQKHSSKNAGDTSGPTGASVGADPSSGVNPSQKHQGADRPGEVPSSEGTGAVKNSKARNESVAFGGSVHDSAQRGSVAPTKVGGTGEQWVKTSGMAAEGGDFDAAKPGAGREADRLLDEKGIKRSEAPKAGNATADGSAGSAGPSDPTGKPSVGEKIKDKLHLGKH